MVDFSVINECNSSIFEIKELDQFISYVVKYLNLENVLFNVIIVDDDKIKYLNTAYRKIDKITDVITFALEDDIGIELPKRVLGDVYICESKVIDQALSYEHSVKRELFFLCLHGILHLLKFDHMNSDDEKIMFDLQDKILTDYGLNR